MSNKHTDETKQKVAELFAKGCTAQEVGKKLGISKCAVNGILRRNKHLKPAVPVVKVAPRPKVVLAPRIIQRKDSAKSPPMAAIEEFYVGGATSDEPESLKRDCLTVAMDECRWVHGEPKSEGWHFCGHPVHKKSYCSHHFDRAYRNVEWRDYKRVLRLR